MRLYNTLSRETEPFAPDGDVRLYVCGVTPYDTTHLGHARTYLVFDVLVRHLRASGHTVRYVQNVTDVDDSILAKAKEAGEDYKALGERYAAIYFDDVRELNMLAADAYPRATEGIEEMVEAVRGLVDAGHAYAADGDVFLRVAAAEGYGKLSRLQRERMLEIEATQDGTTVDDPRKEDPLDILLWRGSAEGEPAWEGPWGPGRPGWHIECSTLAQIYLGSTIDIHGGGTDLVFPHHEAEIAQAELASGESPFARFWVHTGMVTLHGEKMSKSDGNMVFVRDLLEEHSADAVRLYLLRTPYRESLDFDPDALERAGRDAATIAEAAAEAGPAATVGEAGAAVIEALDDDLDTPRAVDALVELADRGDAPPAEIHRLATERLGLRLER